MRIHLTFKIFKYTSIIEETTWYTKLFAMHLHQQEKPPNLQHHYLCTTKKGFQWIKISYRYVYPQHLKCKQPIELTVFLCRLLFMFNITKRVYLLKDENIDKPSYTNKQARQSYRLDKNIIHIYLHWRTYMLKLWCDMYFNAHSIWLL